MNDQLDRAVRSALTDIISTAPARDEQPLRTVGIEPPSRTGHPYLMVAAAALAVVGVGGVALVNSRDAGQAPASAPPASLPGAVFDGVLPTSSADEVTMILPELPDGLRVVSATSPTIRRDESAIHRFLYGAADDPGDPARMIAIEVDPSGTSVIPCHSFTSMPDPQGSAVDFDPAVWQAAATPVDGSSSFTAPTRDRDAAPAASSGAGCVGPNGLAQAGWFAGSTAIGVTGGDAVDTGTLIEFAQGVFVARADALEVTVNPFAYDLTPLVNDDVAYTDEITETAWIASNANLTEVEREQAAADGRPVDEPGELAIWTWYGGGNSGMYAIANPLGAERITVRGHPGYLFASPGEVQIWWAETEDLVVRVRSSNLYDADEVMAVVDQLQRANHSEFSRAATPSG
ncbi:MAG: hypothetical protein WAS51_01730 [Ilumatobacteraceae bacterium]